MSKRSKSKVTHGMSGTRIYGIWRAMKQRTNRRNPNNEIYIKKGIKVCERWMDFANFYEDMGKSYRDDLTIDRVDGNGNYEPTNCRWATVAEQHRNKSSNLYYTINGERKILLDWCLLFKINYRTVIARLKKGMSIEQALSQPVAAVGSRRKTAA